MRTLGDHRPPLERRADRELFAAGHIPAPAREEEPDESPATRGERRPAAARPPSQEVLLEEERETALSLVREHAGRNAKPRIAKLKYLRYGTVVLVTVYGGCPRYVVWVAGREVLSSVEGAEARPVFSRVPGEAVAP